MQSYKKFFIPYHPEADINYIYLLYLYMIAERPEERTIKQDIGFTTIKELLNMINKEEVLISEATLRRMINNENYKEFFEVQQFGSMKWIILNNDFRSQSKYKKPFVVLCPDTYKLLIDQKKNLLAKYTIYLKYMCGLHQGSTDITANQFLSTFGYSTKSHTMKEQISKYNALLEKEKIITIYRSVADDGRMRNTYTFRDL